MASHKNAIKCIRKTERKTKINRNRTSRMRSFVKKAEVFLNNFASSNLDEVKKALIKAESELMKAVTKGILCKNTASRKTSRLVKKFKQLSAS